MATKSIPRLALAGALLCAAGAARAFDREHSAWDRVLKEDSRDGRLDYRRLKAGPALLDGYLDALAKLSESEYQPWSREQKIAFWVDAYNALTVKAILDRYPLQSSFLSSLRFPKNSIRQIPGVWDKLRSTVMGKQVTLDWIEHETLRKLFREPRTHMALVCASVGCPPLRSEAYTGDKLSTQLDDQARAFVGNPNKFKIDRKAGVVHLSPIFKWFGEDFVRDYTPAEGFAGHAPAERAALGFVSRFVGPEDKSYLAEGRYQVKYLDYDWSLNERSLDGAVQAPPN